MLRVILLSLGLLSAVAGCGDSQAVPQFQTSRPHGSLNKFLQLQAGMDKAAVDALLGIRGVHLFTDQSDESHVYVASQYEVASDATDYRYAVVLIFKDGKLDALFDADKAAKDWVANFEKNRVVTPIPSRSPAFDDNQPIRDVLEQKELIHGDQISQSMPALKQRVLAAEEQYREVMRNRTYNNVPVLREALEAGVNVEQLKKDYETNSQYVARFDSEKVFCGMSEEQVKQLFGLPLYTEKLSDSVLVALYGPNKPVDVVPEVSWSPILVLYRDGAVVRVLTSGAFHEKWKEKMWPQK
jgi:hypothetical protein